MLSIIIAIIVAAIDQASKLLAADRLISNGSFDVIKGILRFTYVENRGAAFGLFSESRAVFMISTVVIISITLFVIYKYHGINKYVDLSVGLILGGGIGNMIDRLRLGYVIDFIDFYAFDFWKYVFNVADCAVVVGCILFAVVIIFDKQLDTYFKKKDGEKTDE